ncbi:MAG: 5-dehydro-4-deoxy-D-glucuronate isomerase [Anaerolineae bacterium]|nr:5-dehydro-4-deoxy-D-glucuronate isomerase [Anaerolineae bacterium]
MEIRYSRDPQSFIRMSTAEIREEFLVDDLFVPGKIKLVYSNVDRVIIGSAVPTNQPLSLEAGAELRAKYFAQRRELGVFNIGGQGSIIVDGHEYGMAAQEMLYIGRGSQAISFSSADVRQPARFYIVSLPAHKEYPTTHIPKAQANRIEAGSKEAANARTIYQYIYEGGVPSCQLVIGFTELAPGSVWNTMTAHTHERRSEVYLYFNLTGDNVVFHLMGDPHETRHIVVRDGQAVISPSWSIHAGAGTSNYNFVWAMGGENQAFDDMDPAPLDQVA